MNWLPAFIGSFLGSLFAYGAALLARGTALETDLRVMATDLYERVRNDTMTVSGAMALLEAARPQQRWWKLGRVRRVNRSIEAWLDRFDEAALLSGVQPDPELERYPVPKPGELEEEQ